MAKKRQTGLGANAFFQNINADATGKTDKTKPAPSAAPPAKAPASPAKSKAPKIRTTVTLYPTTMAQLEELKINARRQGKKATFSDILSEAIGDLAAKKGIKT